MGRARGWERLGWERKEWGGGGVGLATLSAANDDRRNFLDLVHHTLNLPGGGFAFFILLPAKII
ncbi:MAG: hypothetical protein ACFFCW_26030 [Candidatus Hodarchaeota archaeon]